MNYYLDVDHLSMTFPTDHGPLNVLNNVNLKVEQGEFISLIGHSGCGKSTVLNIIAGLLQASEGGVILEGHEVNEPGPDRAVVFQNHSLLPWLSVYDNVRLAVDQVFKGSKSKQERHDWTLHNLQLVHMSHALDRKPDEISGGMKQRVGIARALAMEPKVLLMDEPFGALDSLTRSHMQDSLMEIQARLNNTVIMITHDVDEAVLLSDRIIMMTNGPSASIGEILNINLERPRNRLALAEDPRYNHYRAEVVKFLHERHQNPDKKMDHLVTEAVTTESTHRVAQGNKVVKSSKVIEKDQLALGFVPLTDCAPLVIAQEKGFFQDHGLNVSLSRESSWSNIRDKVCSGMLDGAQMLAAMPIKSVLDSSRCHPMVTAMSLGLNGNAVTVSRELYGRMVGTGVDDLNSPQAMGKALKMVIEQDKQAKRAKLSFAIVYPESSHNYLLRYWLADAGIDPDQDVLLRVVPPPQMIHYLRAGMIAGYCVGEPWNSYAVSEGLGRILLTSYDIWNNHPEKVFAVTRNWAQSYPNTHVALIKSMIQACQWLEEPENAQQACEILSQGRFINAPVDVLEKSFSGILQYSGEQPPIKKPDFHVFYRYQANFPWLSHAAWFISQMQRWGNLTYKQNVMELAQSVYRPDIYRQAAAELDISVPDIDFKTEGHHSANWYLEMKQRTLEMGSDLFMDQRIYDVEQIADYRQSFAMTKNNFNQQSVSAEIELEQVS